VKRLGKILWRDCLEVRFEELYLRLKSISPYLSLGLDQSIRAFSIHAKWHYYKFKEGKVVVIR
jgi:hypothetical protein